MRKKKVPAGHIPWDAIVIEDNRNHDVNEDMRLEASIGENGLINPITLILWGDGQYKVIAGRRRARALKKMLPDLPECYYYVKNADLADVISYEENANRLPLTRAEEVQQLRSLRDSGMSVTQIAHRVGRAVSVIGRRIAIANLPPEDFARINRPGVSWETMEKFAAMPEDVRKDVQDYQISQNGVPDPVMPLPGKVGWDSDCDKCKYRIGGDNELFEPDEIGCGNFTCYCKKRQDLIVSAAKVADKAGVPIVWHANMRHWFLNFPVIDWEDTLEGGYEPDDIEAAHFVKTEVLLVTDSAPYRTQMHIMDDRIPDADDSGDDEDDGSERLSELQNKLHYEEDLLDSKRRSYAAELAREHYGSFSVLAGHAGGENILRARLADRALHDLFFPQNWQKIDGDEIEVSHWQARYPVKEKEYVTALFCRDLKLRGLNALDWWMIEPDTVLDAAKEKYPTPKRIVELREKVAAMGGMDNVDDVDGVDVEAE